MLLTIEIILILLAIYPVLGALKWSCGLLFYLILSKRNHEFPKQNHDLDEVFAVIPAYNEEKTLLTTIQSVKNQGLDNDHIMVIDDNSNDETVKIATMAGVRVYTKNENKGKADSLNYAIKLIDELADPNKTAYLLSIDADTILQANGVQRLLDYFYGHNYGGVTANMDVANRENALAKSQVVEFSSIVGIIKRAQVAMTGTMYAYSGATTMYAMAALKEVGGFREDRATEDISIAFDHSLNGYDAGFAPDVKFYMNVPTTLRDLYRQRKRWAKGGIEVLFTNLLTSFKRPKIIMMLFDQFLTIAWSFSWLIMSIYLAYRLLTEFLSGDFYALGGTIGISLIVMTLQIVVGTVQIFIALLVDDNGSKMDYFMFAPLYLLFYWIVNPLTIITQFVPALLSVYAGMGKETWQSPERSVD